MQPVHESIAGNYTYFLRESKNSTTVLLKFAILVFFFHFDGRVMYTDFAQKFFQRFFKFGHIYFGFLPPHAQS